MDINGINNEHAQPVEQQQQVHHASQESIERNQQIREDNTNVSPEAAKVQELVDQVQEMEEIRTEEIEYAQEQIRQGAYNSPEIISQTAEKLLDEI